MVNGTILKREVAEHIVKLDEVKPKKECAMMVTELINAIKLALRLGESAGGVARQNRILLCVLLIFVIKADAISLIKLIIALVP